MGNESFGCPKSYMMNITHIWNITLIKRTLNELYTFGDDHICVLLDRKHLQHQPPHHMCPKSSGPEFYDINIVIMFQLPRKFVSKVA